HGLVVPAAHLEHLLKVEENDQLLPLDDARDVLGVHRHHVLGGRVDFGFVHFEDFRDAVHHHADGLVAQLGHDDPPLGGLLALLHAEALAQVDHGNDAAPEVDHALHILGGPGHPGDGGHADDLPHPVDVDAVHLIAERKHHQLLPAAPRPLAPGVLRRGAPPPALGALLPVAVSVDRVAVSANMVVLPLPCQIRHALLPSLPVSLNVFDHSASRRPLLLPHTLNLAINCRSRAAVSATAWAAFATSSLEAVVSSAAALTSSEEAAVSSEMAEMFSMAWLTCSLWAAISSVAAVFS